MTQRLATPSNRDEKITSICRLCRHGIHKNGKLWVHSSTFADCDRHKEWTKEFES